MKSIRRIALGVVGAAAGLIYLLGSPHHGWAGVDETVVEKYATAAGRPARAPWINTGQGDLLLFCFMIAGAGGGFLAGYCFRSLFPATRTEDTP